MSAPDPMNEENGSLDVDRTSKSAQGGPPSDLGPGLDHPQKSDPATEPSGSGHLQNTTPQPTDRSQAADDAETSDPTEDSKKCEHYSLDADRPTEPVFPDLISDLQRTLQVLEMSPDALERHEQEQIRAQINAPLPPALAHKVEIYESSALVENLDEMLHSAHEFGRTITRGDRYRNRDFAIYIFYIPASPTGPGFKAILDLSPTELILEALDYLEWRLYGVFQFTHLADQHVVEFITYIN